ncbi:uncharacterized protein LOC123316755 [Coccinella septempunctata]|uniref:uncharacterized protein LOC123316755 n=1 Tax=Coccinella septempunctata TaxID=41139 RepID=UPI001D095EDC|nr:uncharacterized protein LOC123316755 [Coccinella septempunctata]
MGGLTVFLAFIMIQICQVAHILVKELLPHLTLILFLSSLIFFSILVHLRFTYWTRRGVKQKCTWPFRDDMSRKIIEKRPFGDMLMDIYNRFSGTRYVGFYQFHKPILMLKDPDLIKFVCAKSNLFFQDHTNLVPRGCDPLWNKTIFALKGQRWLRARSHLTPFFLDGRMRNLYEVTRSYAYDLTNSLVPIQSSTLEANFKELFAECATEVVARTVYDLQNKSFKNVSSMFYSKLRDASENYGTWNLIKVLLVQTFPCTGKLLKARIFSEDLSVFFSQITDKIIRHREEFGIERPDLISLLTNIRTKENDSYAMRTIMKHDPGADISKELIERDMLEAGIDLTEETIVATAMTFFYFGYDIISTVLCFLFYELAKNPSIQKRLIKDLDNLRAKHRVLPFNDLFMLPYLSMVISETLRKWPPIYFTERRCNRSFTFTKQSPNEKNVHLSVGDNVWIPIWAIHRDPKYWWNPEVFDPDRFIPQTQNTILHHTFIPFGSGPRGCLASKFTIMQIKIIVSEILTIFEVVPVKNTPQHVVLDHNTFNLSPKDGIWLGLKKRFIAILQLNVNDINITVQCTMTLIYDFVYYYWKDMDSTVVTVSVLLSGFVLYIWHYSYWTRRNVRQRLPFPIFGDNFRHFFRLSPYHEVLTSLYNSKGFKRYVGFYQYLRPGLMIRCPELIKRICIRDQHFFHDRISFLPKSADELWNKNLFALQAFSGEEWREMRDTLSPSFTGNKMRTIFGLVEKYSEKFCGFLNAIEEDLIEVELKDLFTRFTTDVIATVAFGLNIDSLNDPENEFYVTVNKAMRSTNYWKNFKLQMTLIFPIFGRILGANIFDDEVSDFFRDAIKKAIEYRQESKIERPDMLQLLMRAHEPDPEDDESTIRRKLKLDHDDITSQALVFFLGGFETASNAMCFMAYELATNEKIQTKLIEEIDAYKEEFGLLTYDGLQRMPYLDMVVSETLRKWPPLLNMDRMCVRPYTIEALMPWERPVEIERHTLIWIPVWCIHRDPNLWENPEVFDPERFSKENKRNIYKGTYIPFGMGPRSCLGARFAQMEIKVLFYELLRRFRIVPLKKSEIPFVPLSHSFSLASAKGFQFGLEKRHYAEE